MKSGSTSKAGGKASGVAVWSWALYDFSNTIFSISILSFFFPLWLGDELGAGAPVVNGATAVSALLVVVTAPVLGVVADLRQRRVPYLVVLTLIAVVLTAALDLAGGVLVAVALFVAADVAYQSALVFYNSLLPGVSAGRGAGRVSGYGTAAGYVGTILALVVLTFFVTEAVVVREALGPFGGWIETGGQSNSNAFLPTAVLYLLFSLPAFFLVPDRVVREPRPVGIFSAYRSVASTARNMRSYGGIGTFIVATFLYTDAANTAIANMALYGREVFGMGQGEIRNLLLFSTVFAVVGSVGSGHASDRIGPKKTLVGVLVVWIVAILLASAALAPWMLMLSGPLVGVALGGTWTVSRVMLVALSPPEKLGEFFGLFSLTGKLSAVMGPAITAGLLWAFEDLGTAAYRIAIGSLALVMALGLFFLRRVPDTRPQPGIEEPVA
ncbi:MAG: MFS transporter [Actinomycetota bacterium]|nr:MFS transporter [Actinomycetota bacterium]